MRLPPDPPSAALSRPFSWRTTGVMLLTALAWGACELMVPGNWASPAHGVVHHDAHARVHDAGEAVIGLGETYGVSMAVDDGQVGRSVVRRNAGRGRESLPVASRFREWPRVARGVLGCLDLVQMRPARGGEVLRRKRVYGGVCDRRVTEIGKPVDSGHLGRLDQRVDRLGRIGVAAEYVGVFEDVEDFEEGDARVGPIDRADADAAVCAFERRLGHDGPVLLEV